MKSPKCCKKSMRAFAVDWLDSAHRFRYYFQCSKCGKTDYKDDK